MNAYLVETFTVGTLNPKLVKSGTSHQSDLQQTVSYKNPDQKDSD